MAHGVAGLHSERRSPKSELREVREVRDLGLTKIGTTMSIAKTTSSHHEAGGTAAPPGVHAAEVANV